MSSDFLSTSAIDQLVDQARLSRRRRMHRNLHTSFADPSQRLFNAIWRDSYIPPHRHSGVHDDETLIAIRGAFAAVLFEGDGKIDHVIPCGSGFDRLGVVIPIGQWHSVVALTEVAVLLEIKAGPFDPGRAKEYARWAPAEADPESAAYLERMASNCAPWVGGHVEPTDCRYHS